MRLTWWQKWINKPSDETSDKLFLQSDTRYPIGSFYWAYGHNMRKEPGGILYRVTRCSETRFNVFAIYGIPILEDIPIAACIGLHIADLLNRPNCQHDWHGSQSREDKDVLPEFRFNYEEEVAKGHIIVHNSAKQHSGSPQGVWPSIQMAPISGSVPESKPEEISRDPF